MDWVKKIKEIILENNYFDTLAGMRFQEWNNIKMFKAVISFSGRSKKQESYELLSPSSDGDYVYVTHLMVDNSGQVLVQISPEDTDDFSMILHPNVEPIDNFDDDILEEWVDLLTF